MYNNRGLVTQINYTKPNGEIASNLRVDLTYDAAGNRQTMEDSVGAVTYNHDTWSRIKDETRTFNDFAGSFRLSYTYNLAGQLKSLGDPFGTTISYGYDGAGQITGVTATGPGPGTYISGIQYRAWGAPKQITYGNNARTNLSYNTRLQVTSFSVLDHNGASFLNSTFTYHPDSRVNTVKDNRDRRFDRKYAYDHQGRVVQGLSGNEAGLGGTLLGPYRQNYEYDVWNNMTGRSGRLWSGLDDSYATTFINNRSDSWTYDAEGNPTQIEGPTTFEYNAAGQQLTSTSPPRFHVGNQTGFVIRQSYDGDGLLAKQETNGSAIYFLRSTVLGGYKVSEIRADGTKRAGYVYAISLLVAVQQGAVQWVHPNPATNSEGRTRRVSDGLAFRASELDPLGNNVGLEDPGAGPDETTAPDLMYPRGGDPTDLSGGCTLDGMAIPCSTLSSMNPDAKEVARPTTAGIWDKSQGRYVGIAVFKPWANNYQGVVNGHVIAGNPGGKVTIDGRGSSRPPVLGNHNGNPSNKGRWAQTSDDEEIDPLTLLAVGSDGELPTVGRIITRRDIYNSCVHYRESARNFLRGLWEAEWDRQKRDFAAGVAWDSLSGAILGAGGGFFFGSDIMGVPGGLVAAGGGAVLGHLGGAWSSFIMNGLRLAIFQSNERAGSTVFSRRTQ